MNRNSLLLASVVLSLAFAPSLGSAVSTADTTLPQPLSAASGAWTGSQIFLFGGNSSSLSDEIVRYDPDDSQTHIMAETLPSGRHRMSTAWDGQTVWLFGGVGPGATDQILSYAPGSDDLAVVDAQLPSPRGGTSAVWAGDVAYVFGGKGETVLDEIVRFDPGTGQTEVVATLPEALHRTSAIWTGERAYIFGGQDASGDGTDTIHVFTPDSGEVFELRETLPEPVSGSAAAWDSDLAYVVGGGTDGIAIVDPAQRTVTQANESLPSTLTDAAAVWGDRFVYVLGGEDLDSAPSDAILRYHPPNRPPTPRFAWDASASTVTVDASASSDLDGDVVEYRWEWGDGETDQGGPIAEHTYAEPGEYVITLTVRDDDGAARTTTDTVRVLGANLLPEPSFTTSIEGLTLEVDARGSADPDGEIVRYTWDWGDGTDRSRGPTATHTYDSPGSYTVRLTLVDDRGGSAAQTAEVQAGWFIFSDLQSGLTVIGGVSGAIIAAFIALAVWRRYQTHRAVRGLHREPEEGTGEDEEAGERGPDSRER